MVIVRRSGKKDVLEMARMRIKNTFSNGVPVYLSMSGGKDSVTLASLVYDLIQEGEIDASQLTVQYIDEEAIYPCIERIVKKWRKKFKMVGATFNWYCLEVKHFNALNSLSTDQSFITWDRHKEDVWIREKPSFAITYHPLLRPRVDSYQQFLERIEVGGISMVGVRVAESVQRLMSFSKSERFDKVSPIYDWKDSDVWKYIKDNDVEIPDAYYYYYMIGKGARELRLSMFFSSDTVNGLVGMEEFYPGLMDKIVKREPNAYLVSMYWDTEMFKRRTVKRKKLEESDENYKPKDYKKEVTKLLKDINKNFHTREQRALAKDYRKLLIRSSGMAEEKHYRDIYESLLVGDPVRRKMRGVMVDIFESFRKKSERAERGMEK